MKNWKRWGIVLMVILAVVLVIGCDNPTSSDGGSNDDSGDTSGGDVSDSPWTTSSVQPGLGEDDPLLGFEVAEDGTVTILYTQEVSSLVHNIIIEQYDGSSWTVLDPNLTVKWKYVPALTLDQNDLPVITTLNDSYVPEVYSYNGSSWDAVDNMGLSTAESSETLGEPYMAYKQMDVAVDSTGYIYISYLADAGTYNRVATFGYDAAVDGTGWSFLGLVDTTASTNNAAGSQNSDRSFDLAVNSTNDVYLAYIIDDATTSGLATFNTLADPPAFEIVGTSTSTQPYAVSLIFDTTDSPYIVRNNGSYSGTGSISLHSVSSEGTWSQVGGVAVTESDSYSSYNRRQTAVFYDGSDTIVAYVDPHDSTSSYNSIALKKYDGTSSYIDAAEAIVLGDDNPTDPDFGNYFTGIDVFARSVGSKYYVAYRKETYNEQTFHVAEYDTAQ